MKLKNFAMKHFYLFSLLVIICSVAFLFTSSAIFHDESVRSMILINLPGRILPSLLLLLLLRHLQLTKDIYLIKKNTFHGVLHFWSLFLVLIAFELIAWLKNPVLDITPKVMEIIALIFYMFCVGLFEEMLFRGVLFTTMKKKWAASPNGILKAAIVSSCMFGFLHIFNLFDTPELFISIIAQVLYAVLYGIFFCGVYVKCKNLWSIIIAHAIVDIIGNLPPYISSYMAEISNEDSSLLLGILTVVMILPFALLGLRYLRKAQEIWNQQET